MKKNNSKAIYFLFLTGLVLILVNLLFGIPQGEGFNPSDDGVILGQSFRLLAGQIPHLDFISIRPAGSALFHALSFFSPLPLEMSARWITLLQYLIYSFLWAWMLVKSMPQNSDSTFWIISMSVLIFVLNQNYYNLFPWTTIDALFFFSLGFFIFWNWKGVRLSKTESWMRFFLIFFFSGYAALCRQSFALPVLVLAFVVFIESLHLKKIRPLVSSLICGLFPYWLYGYILIKNEAFKLFLDQMTGRTELWQTGIVRFGQEFWESPVLILYILLIVSFLLFRFVNSPVLKTKSFMKSINLGVLLLLGTTLILIILVFLRPENLFSYSFIFFWLLLVLLIVKGFLPKQGMILHRLSLWVLFVAWTSSISLGDNAPVFFMGVLAGALILTIMSWMTAGTWLPLKFAIARRAVLLISAFLILGLGIFGQKSSNYRDLDSGKLHFIMELEYPGMGKIRTNPRTYEYMKEIRRIYTGLDQPEGRFVVLPNASLIYPLLNSHNPMPLDWMQGPEFVGQEEDLLKRLSNINKTEGIYLLFDKYNSKWIADSLMSMEFDLEIYPYYPFLQGASIPLDMKSDWFDVRLWK